MLRTALIILILCGLYSLSNAESYPTEFKKFGKCTKSDIQLGCKTNIAGICDPYNPVNCIFQCFCPKETLKKAQWVDQLLETTQKKNPSQ